VQQAAQAAAWLVVHPLPLTEPRIYAFFYVAGTAVSSGTSRMSRSLVIVLDTAVVVFKVELVFEVVRVVVCGGYDMVAENLFAASCLDLRTVRRS